MKNQILNVKSYQQVVQFTADLVAPTARKQWYSLPRTDWYSFPRNEWYSLTRILQTTAGIITVGVIGTAAAPLVAGGGLVYGIWSLTGGSDWINDTWGYRE